MTPRGRTKARALGRHLIWALAPLLLLNAALWAGPNVYVITEAEKKEVYVGEGINIKYYFLSRNKSYEDRVLSYPKLTHFLKRFYNEYGTFGTMKVGDADYFRNLKYSVRVFPLKAGKIVVDPLTMELKEGDDILLGKVSGQGEAKKIISGKDIEISVKPLPKADTSKLPGYLGLAGALSFSMRTTKNDFKTGENVEIDLTAQGDGPLELMPAPDVNGMAGMKVKGLEFFSVNSRLNYDNSGMAFKNFHYVFVANSRLKFFFPKISISYFNIKGEKYETVELACGPISVEGLDVRQKSEDHLPDQGKTAQPSRKVSGKEDEVTPEVGMEGQVFPPILTVKSGDLHWHPEPANVLNALLALLLTSLLALTVKRAFWPADPRKWAAKRLINSIRRRGPDFSSLFRLIMLVKDKQSPVPAAVGTPVERLCLSIESLPLSAGARTYFLEVADWVTEISFGAPYERADLTPVFERKYFKELYLMC